MGEGWTRGGLLVVAFAAACERETNEPSPARSASAPALPALVSAPTRPPPCRALRVEGEALTDAGRVSDMAAIDGRSWVTLAAGAELVVRHGPSAREFSLHGPGRFLPCRGGIEQVLTATGTVKSSMGTGVRPGADFSIATPFGSVSYGDADLESSVEPAAWRLEVRRGEAATQAVPGTRGLPGAALSGPNGNATVSGTPLPAMLVENCKSAAREAAESADRVLSAKDKAALGRDAALQLAARRRARAACASAEAGLDRERDEAHKDRLKQQVLDAERLWRTIPLR